MQLSAAGLALLKQSEGFRSSTYLDVAGIPTIGYGHKLLPGESYPNGIAEAQATLILSRDVALSEGAVSRLARIPLTQGQFDALVDFVFNLGQGRLVSSTLLKDLNAGQSDAAALQLLQWDHAGAKELTALKTRRAAEYELWTGHTVPSTVKQ
jgi:lysozyme